MNKDMQVIKRSGEQERVDLEKMHRVVAFACDGISGVSESEIEIKSQISFFDNIKTEEIQETLIKAAADLIDENAPNYQYVASRLINYHLRKQIYGDFLPCPVLELVRRNVEAGFYDPALLTMYTEAEWAELDAAVRHERDFDIVYAGMEQFRGKYLVQNRTTGQILETPQMAYLLIAASLFSRYPKETRLQYVKDYYHAVSTFQISLPTPVMAGVRTPQRQFSSCVLIECGDSLDSINATCSSIVKYVSQRAGIGIGAGAIRSFGSPVRNGDTSHTGVIPFYRMFHAATSSCNQGGIRKGSATLSYPWWQLEFEDVIVLKNNKGTESNRVRHMDYAIQLNKLAYQRLVKGKDVSFFSPSDVPGLYDAFFRDQDEFVRLYEAAEKDKSIRRKTMSAIDMFGALMKERKETGRIYVQNVDHCNTHSSFRPEVAPVRMTNLCTEVVLPSKPLNSINDGATMQRVRVPRNRIAEFKEYREKHNGILYNNTDLYETDDGYEPDYEYFNALVADDSGAEIAICTLSAINIGKFNSKEEMQKPCELAVRALDELLDFQRYPVLAAEIATMRRRPLGVGLINLAHWMARNDMTYSRPKLKMVDEWMEAWSYYLIDASARLAEEKGPCLNSDDTRYSQGIVPMDTRKPEIDELVRYEERMPWDDLRSRLKQHGIRNSTLMALMPAETSAQISNSTNGIEPPRGPVSIKQSKHGVLRQVVPGIHRLKDKYEYLWDQRSPRGYLKIMLVITKYLDQAASVNTSYNPLFYKNEKIPMSELLQDLLFYYKYGGKNLYYCNTNDGAGEVDIDKLGNGDSDSGEAESAEGGECESCVI